MSQYFLEPNDSFCGNVKAELDPPNYATKSYVQKTAGVNKSSFAKKG